MSTSHHPSASPIPISQSSTMGRAPSTSQTARNPSQSIGTGSTSTANSQTPGRRSSRATHPPMIPPKALSHTEALEALRSFLKDRSSYDVFPVSFRLIVLDTQLKVKKALDVMLLYGETSYRSFGQS